MEFSPVAPPDSRAAAAARRRQEILTKPAGALGRLLEPVLDGGGYWGIGWVSALIADYEGFFTDFQRHDELVQATPALDEDSLAVLTKGRERLLIAMNSSATPKEVALTLKDLPGPCSLTEYETKKTHDPTKPLALTLASGEIKEFADRH